MAQPFLLNGEVDGAAELKELRSRVEELERNAERIREQSEEAAQRTVEAILRKMFSQLHQATSVLIGEKEAPSTGSSTVWPDRIAKARPTHARILQALLDGGGEMTLQQIRTVTKYGGNTSTYLNELAAKNWVQKIASGIWALKG